MIQEYEKTSSFDEQSGRWEERNDSTSIEEVTTAEQDESRVCVRL